MKKPYNIASLPLRLLLSISMSQLFAQTPVTSDSLLAAMAMNAKRVVQYEWKQRVTVIRRGNPSEPVISQIRFDSSGQMQRTAISAPQQKQMGGIRGKIAAEVKENADEQYLAHHNDMQTTPPEYANSRDDDPSTRGITSR